MKDKRTVGDGILLTFTTLALKTAGVMFSAKLAAVAGAEAMGLSSQIASVYSFAVTAAAAGVNLGAMRLTSESRGAGRESEIRSGIRCALSYCAGTGTVTAVLLFLLAPFFALKLIGAPEAILPLRLLAAAIPCISAAGAFHGYFAGVRRVYKSAVVNVLEQVIRITVTLSGLYGISGEASPIPGILTQAVSGSVSRLLALDAQIFGGITASSARAVACLTVVFGSVCSELISFSALLLLYLADSRRYTPSRSTSHARRAHLFSEFLRITAPMAVSAILRSGLSSAEHLMLPIGLRKFGSENALAEYGTVGGMAIPVILYPMALMNAFAQLNTVNISAEASAGATRDELREQVAKGLSFALTYGIGCSAILRAFAHPLGDAIFHNPQAGKYIALLAAYASLAYLDHIADSMLKGLDCQAYVMKVNIADSALGLLCTATLVPLLGVGGYILSLYLCEFVNCVLSVGKLMSVLGFSPDPLRFALIPALCAAISVGLLSHYLADAVPLIPAIILTALLYFSLTTLAKSALTRHKGKQVQICIRPR